jgi:acyl-coenzyme A thioesterase PaaI-like protein
MPLVHHEQCFGCGRANLFGLFLEVDEIAPGTVAGRCFVKQDHQGPDPGQAHEGVVAAALCEAMALACGLPARAVGFELTLDGHAPVGAFVELRARVDREEGELAYASATATADGALVASARGRYRRAQTDCD